MWQIEVFNANYESNMEFIIFQTNAEPTDMTDQQIFLSVAVVMSRNDGTHKGLKIFLV